ncbi:adhesion G protein-coupled receptor G3-like isoform X2 [Pseudoliparis swirei]|uniref:adhesion G protein-coupled receptor G3-like isoform X2 n=1 Tax=Pseudoliparis swirei TaxID=2059687 RepID=UPI0024BED2F0|nr:adhesion G protein-coupled receptor G3-like isoform X2 [Pseudoliparis swirei]
MSWTTWVLFVGLLWSYPVSSGQNETEGKRLQDCLMKKQHFIIADNFSGFITGDEHLDRNQSCILFLENNMEAPKMFGKIFPQMKEHNGSRVLLVSEDYITVDGCLCVLEGKCDLTSFTLKGPCMHTCLQRAECQQQRYNGNLCNKMFPQVEEKYIINMERRSCHNCNAGKLPENQIDLKNMFPTEHGEVIDAAKAKVMNKMAELARSINSSSVSMTLGEGVFGILMKQTDPQDVMEVSFAIVAKRNKIYMIEDKATLTQYSRSVTMPKEAFNKAVCQHMLPFVSVLRFNNLISDEENSTLLGNEVFAVEMGITVADLTDKIHINYKGNTYGKIPSCGSWNGEGSRPLWTKDGCQTKINNDTITCECSHLTFFAILLSSSHVNSLTIITQIGCVVSMFFLSVVLFMHFLLRRTKATTATIILIHLVSAMFLLNLTFLINNFVAKLGNSLGCMIEAAFMHYFMLTTFTWFAVQAFHLCLNLYQGGHIVIRHYILKVSIPSWVLPGVVGMVLFSSGKYGKQVIATSDTEHNVTICWITDNDVHYIVNIGYYALVFLFTFTTFIIVVSWLFCLQRVGSGKSSAEINTNIRGISIIMGLCCMMGITWGFAFFASGILRIPSYYIFTVLNSFQGFFLFIYYCKTSNSREPTSGNGSAASISTVQSSLQSSLHSSENTYVNFKLRQDIRGIKVGR